jgi:16S rRNA (guanine527-N7)-methyltransferase
LGAFARYLRLLDTWSRRINLTAIRDPEAILNCHFLDSLAVVPLLGPVRRLIDVGSGAGFPGLVLALVRPDLSVTLLEPRGKKAAFLRAAALAIGVRCEVVGSRLEDFAEQPIERFDAAISRAVLPPLEWLMRGRRLVGPRGATLVMTGREVPPRGFGDLSRVALVAYQLPDGQKRNLARYISCDLGPSALSSSEPPRR